MPRLRKSWRSVRRNWRCWKVSNPEEAKCRIKQPFWKRCCAWILVWWGHTAYKYLIHFQIPWLTKTQPKPTSFRCLCSFNAKIKLPRTPRPLANFSLLASRLPLWTSNNRKYPDPWQKFVSLRLSRRITLLPTMEVSKTDRKTKGLITLY